MTSLEDKIERLHRKARVLWPKYDPDLDTMVNGRQKVHQYLENVFSDCKMISEYDELTMIRNVNDLIDNQVHRSNRLNP